MTAILLYYLEVLNMKKRFFSSLIAASLIWSSSIAATASAETISLDYPETVTVGAYDCYVENDQYYTVLDGETYLVINLDNAVALNDEDGISSIAKSTSQKEVSIVDTTYSGSIDITNGDDTTPIFVGRESGYSRGFKISTKFFFSNDYTVSIYVYDSIGSKWHKNSPIKITFNQVQSSHVLFTGTMVEYYTKAYIVFHKSGSTGEPKFNYTFSEAR